MADRGTLPDSFDWSLTGLETESWRDWAELGVTAREGPPAQDLPASVLLPQRPQGPGVFSSIQTTASLFEWNKSFIYVTTAAYFATRIEGAPPYIAGDPDRRSPSIR